MIDRLVRHIVRLDPRHRSDPLVYLDRFKGERSLLFRQVHESDTLFIFFGSMNGKIGPISPFEFLHSTTNIAANKLYVRDFYQSYYHKGLHGYTHSLQETTNLLNAIIRENEVTQLICAGHCSGGYASILFGALLGADVVHAFSPQTFISVGQKVLQVDPSFHQYARKMYASTFNTRYFDLNNLTPESHTQFILHYRASVRYERIHAFHLAYNNVVRIRYHSTTTPVRILRDNGLLIDVLTNACA
jgi:hypothetical protein